MADLPIFAQGLRRVSLAWLLGISLVLHLALIWLVPVPQRGRSVSPGVPPLQVRLGPSEKLDVLVEPARRGPDDASSRNVAIETGSAVKGVSTQTPTSVTRLNISPPETTQGAVPDTAALLESARQIARKESTRFDGQQRKPPELEGGKASPETVVAAMATRSRIQPEETRLADGTLRVVNQWGVRYCSKAPPDFQRSGPVGHDAVVTNCL